jgi:MoxR-like ATPase
MSDQKISAQHVSELQQKLSKVSAEVGKVIVGQAEVIQQLLMGMLAGGHCLLEGVPGLAKTLMVSSLAQSLELNFTRVQFTPDLMPSDIIGTEILETDHDSGERFFKFQQGPVFTNILLADEINRTPPKTQAALLEAMQEKKVSYAGQSYDLPKPFFVLATQNPVEQAGTYPLPEAQLDRFLLFIRVGYPSAADEIEVLRRTTGNVISLINAVLHADDIIALQKLVRDVEVADPLYDYVSRLVRATRPDAVSNKNGPSKSVQEFVRWGAGPRAGQALILCAKARAFLEGRFAATVEDIKAVAHSVLRHRILLNFQAEAENMQTDSVIDALLSDISPPTSPLGQ